MVNAGLTHGTRWLVSLNLFAVKKKKVKFRQPFSAINSDHYTLQEMLNSSSF